MFTGLIEKRGTVVRNEPKALGHRLIIDAAFERIAVGESIAVDGVCLTVLPGDGSQLAFDVSPETRALTTLGDLVVGQEVNLERAMSATSRFGGHYVSGHVDTTACLHSLRPVGDYIEMIVGDFRTNAKPYLLSKGSITLHGVSLTINEVTADEEISLMLVPHTLSVTTLGRVLVGQRLNVEFDYLTRIIAHQVALVTCSIQG